MLFNQSVSSVFKAPSLQKAQNTSQVSGIARITGRESGQRIASTTIQRTFVIQEAPKNYIMSQRIAQATGSYRYQLDQSQSKDAVDQQHVQRMGMLLSDLKRPDAADTGFIQKYLNLLNKERARFMESDDYEQLPSIYDQVEQDAREGQVEETDATAKATTDTRQEKDTASETKKADAGTRQQAVSTVAAQAVKTASAAPAVQAQAAANLVK